jgi:hypothetical protein
MKAKRIVLRPALRKPQPEPAQKPMQLGNEVVRWFMGFGFKFKEIAGFERVKI